MEDKTRDVSLDLIRAIAVILVLFVHSFSYIGFYEEQLKEGVGFISSSLRAVFVCCVPLFLLLTGYLNGKKTPTKKYYFGLLRVIISYLCCGIVCQFFLFSVDSSEFDLKKSILSFFDFSAVPYGWYIGMYVGLYLIIPFLNVLWKSVNTKQRKEMLTCFLILTVLPSILNNFNLLGDPWFQGNEKNRTILCSEWWENLYPVTYFFVGNELRDLKNKKDFYKKNRGKSILGLISSIIAWGGGKLHTSNQFILSLE